MSQKCKKCGCTEIWDQDCTVCNGVLVNDDGSECEECEGSGYHEGFSECSSCGEVDHTDEFEGENP